MALGAARCFVCPDGVDESWVASPDDFPQREMHDPMRLLFLGRVEPFQKGLDLLVDAVVSTTLPKQVELMLVGPGAEQFHRHMLERRNPEAMAFVSARGAVSGDEKANLFRWADFFVHTSRFEGMAKSVREAAGQGLPILASYESNFGDWADAKTMGIACHANSDSIRCALLRAAQLDAQAYSRLSRGAYEFSRQTSWGMVSIRFRNAIADALLQSV
jgi:glycosyltransferase involved in cell wall biosynthesis